MEDSKIIDLFFTRNEDAIRHTADTCKFRPSSHTCTDIQPRCHGISATPSRSGATVVRGAVTPLQPVNQALSQRAMIFLDCS